MSDNQTPKPTHPAEIAVAALVEQLSALRIERDDYRAKWLKQIDINDKLKSSMAHHGQRMEELEAMCRE